MFTDKIILVLGGTGNIGSAIADAFKKENAAVCCHGRASEKYPADVKNLKESAKMIEKIIAEFGKIDVLINSISAPYKIGNFESKNWKDFLKQLNAQLKALVEITNLVIPHMKKQKKGKIINILSSVVAGDPPPGMSDYVTSKYSVLGLTKCLAKELGRYNIAVNAISPGLIDNDFTNHLPKKIMEMTIAQTPLGRLTTEQDIANAALFLASEKSDFITGENIIVSGGNTLG